MPVDAAYRLLHAIEPIFGAFYDSVYLVRNQLDHIRRGMADEQAKRQASNPEVPKDYLNASIAYGVDGADGKPEFIHSVPYITFERRNERNGQNTVLLGNSIVVAIFSLWEHRFRREMELEFGMPKDALQCPLFGDIRLLRNAIVHSSGTLREPISRLEVVDWLAAGQRVEFDEGKIVWISEQIAEFVHTADRFRPAV